MKGYVTSNGYMGYVDGKYILFASDKEDIVVKMEGLGEIGHVANSAHTVIGESMSAGRIYDKIGDTAKAKVVLVTPHGTICSISKKSLIDNKHKKIEEAVDE